MKNPDNPNDPKDPENTNKSTEQTGEIIGEDGVQYIEIDLSGLENPDITPAEVVTMLENGSPNSLIEKAEEAASMMGVIRRKGGGIQFLTDMLKSVQPIIDETLASEKEREHIVRLRASQRAIVENKKRANKWDDIIKFISEKEGKEMIENIVLRMPEVRKNTKTYWATVKVLMGLKAQYDRMNKDIETDQDEKTPSVSPKNVLIGIERPQLASEAILRILKAAEIEKPEASEMTIKTLHASTLETDLPTGNVNKAIRSETVPKKKKKENMKKIAEERAKSIEKRSRANSLVAASEMYAGADALSDYSELFSEHETVIERWAIEMVKGISQSNEEDEIEKMMELIRDTQGIESGIRKGQFVNDIKGLQSFFEQFIAQMELRKQNTRLILMAATREIFQNLYDQYAKRPNDFQLRITREVASALGKPVDEQF